MAGKPIIPESVHEYIRELIASGKSKRAVMATVGCSNYTIRKALDPDFVERERERCRLAEISTRPHRSQDRAIKAYKRERADTDEYREASRLRMATLRSRRKSAVGDGTPTPEQIRAARKAAGLTQTAAGALIGAALSTWQAWEAGTRNMPAIKWEMWQATAPSA